MDLLSSVGKTPLVRLSYFSGRVAIWAKLEGSNPGGSVKDRAVLFMLRGLLRGKAPSEVKGIVEPTSGNTGIALAMLCARMGIRCVLTMPDNMSLERIKLLRALGAELFLTPASSGMAGAVEEAMRMSREEGLLTLDQFSNPLNPLAHELTTGPEALSQMSPLLPDAFVAGVGTGGTVTGVGRALKRANPLARVFAVEPASSPVLSGGRPGPHRIQGIGAGFVPPVLDVGLLDGVIRVSDERALEMTALLGSKEGLPCGISSGANLAGALEVASSLPEGSNVLTVFPDRLDRYLSAL